MVGYIAHVLIELWRPITFEPITYLIVSMRQKIRLTDLKKNNYIARLAKDLFKSYGSTKFYKDMGFITDHYVKSEFCQEVSLTFQMKKTMLKIGYLLQTLI